MCDPSLMHATPKCLRDEQLMTKHYNTNLQLQCTNNLQKFVRRVINVNSILERLLWSSGLIITPQFTEKNLSAISPFFHSRLKTFLFCKNPSHCSLPFVLQD